MLAFVVKNHCGSHVQVLVFSAGVVMYSIKTLCNCIRLIPIATVASAVRRINSGNMDLNKVVDCLESLAPIRFAEEWDNVGLLVEPSGPHVVDKIMLTNDLTEPVMAECIDRKVNLIVSYHPPIFMPMKRLTSAAWKQRLIVKAIENKIAIYSPHTAWDAAVGGVNDWLVSGLGKVVCSRPIKSIMDSPTRSKLSENQVNVENIGAGRICKLADPTMLEELIVRIKSHLNLSHVRLALGNNCSLSSSVQTIALCAGAGSSVLEGITADVYLTGEMSHHQVLDAVANGITVILCEHSNTERGYLSVFKGKLQSALGCIDEHILLSVKDSDPLVVH